MDGIQSKERVDAAANVWAWTWGALFVVWMTMLSVANPQLSGYNPGPNQASVAAGQSNIVAK
jgi:hypothetical protein